jgi:hypothetical protein
MNLLSWLLRAILIAIAINFILRLLFRARRPQTAGRASRRPPERLGGALVRDPQCGTYIPISGAIQVGSGDAVHYFCSDGCRAAWTALHGKP